MKIARFYKVKLISLFSYFASKEIRVLPFFGLDFSQANLTFDDDICLHRTKDDKPKIYLTLLSKLTDALKCCSTNYWISYAFGCKARTLSHTSDWLALSGDYFNPHINLEDIENRYKTTVNKVEFALPPNHSEIFK